MTGAVTVAGGCVDCQVGLPCPVGRPSTCAFMNQHYWVLPSPLRRSRSPIQLYKRLEGRVAIQQVVFLYAGAATRLRVLLVVNQGAAVQAAKRQPRD